MAASTSTESFSLSERLRQSAARYPTHTAILFDGQSTDYATFDELSNRFAATLAAQGVEKSDRIGLYCINSDAFAIAYFGIVKAGATVVPINLLLNPHEIAYILEDAGATGLVYYEALQDAVRLFTRRLDSLRTLVCIGKEAPESGVIPWAAALAAANEPPDVDFEPAEDLAAVIYTSGTTGKPKGAMLTHRNLVSNTSSVQQALDMVPGEERFLVVLPMFHSFAATAGMLAPLLHGCTVVPVPKFDPELVANTIASSQATLFLGVPSMFSTLLRLPAPFTPKLASLRFCASGGAAMPAEVMKQFEERYGKSIYEGDGPTECSPVTCCNPIGGKRKLGSVGRVVPDVEMRIVDDEGNDLARGEIGEICVRGPNVMKGYWQRPDETADAFFGEWFRTGDLGYVDEDDYFFIVDRKKDMIIVNGMNVYPRVIEEILYQFEPIREAAVVGEPHDLHGEIPVAYVALKEAGTADAASIRAFCREYLGPHEVPRKVHILQELPKTATGKIVKRELRKHGEHERGIDSSRR